MKKLLLKAFDLCPIILICLIVGGFIGYQFKPTCSWDIMDDERACVIYWEDGTMDLKSQIARIDVIKPNESVTLIIKSGPELEGLRNEPLTPLNPYAPAIYWLPDSFIVSDEVRNTFSEATDSLQAVQK